MVEANEGMGKRGGEGGRKERDGEGKERNGGRRRERQQEREGGTKGGGQPATGVAVWLTTMLPHICMAPAPHCAASHTVPHRLPHPAGHIVSHTAAYVNTLRQPRVSGDGNVDGSSDGSAVAPGMAAIVALIAESVRKLQPLLAKACALHEWRVSSAAQIDPSVAVELKVWTHVVGGHIWCGHVLWMRGLATAEGSYSIDGRAVWTPRTNAHTLAKSLWCGPTARLSSPFAGSVETSCLIPETAQTAAVPQGAVHVLPGIFRRTLSITRWFGGVAGATGASRPAWR
eukprot:365706-Chlamydomonas_euryale.AAC.18